jgi:hypothetical protein
VKSGKFKTCDIPLGNAFQLGTISLPLALRNKAEKLKLEVTVGSFTNKWDFWVYPAKNDPVANEEKIRVVSSMDQATQKLLEEGGTVLLTLKKGTLKPEFGGNVAIGFSSIFWNTAWTKGQPPHTLGILCDPKQPALADFPTEYHSNWQWWDAMSHSGAINLTTFPTGLQPIIRVIDDWFTNRPLALLFEAKTGKGRILISGIDLVTDLENRPEARQLRYSLKRYMSGNQFNPSTLVDFSVIQRLTN